MKQMKWIALFSLVYCLGACGVQHDAFSGNSIQKRKYTKGFYWNKSAGLRKNAGKHPNSQIEIGIDQITAEEKKTENEVIVNQPIAIYPATFEVVTSIEQQNDGQRVAKKTVAIKKHATPQAPQRKLRTSSYYLPLQKIKHTINTHRSAGSGMSANLILLIILALFIPPLAVLIFEGPTKRFWIDLLLTLIGVGLGLGLGGIAYICALAAVIYALLIVLEYI